MDTGWNTIEFDRFTTLKRGKDLTRGEFKDGVIPVAGSNGVMGFHDTANVNGPGVTVGRSGSVGRVTFYKRDFWAHNTALFVSDFHGNDPRFAAYFLDFLRLGRFGSGASVPTLDRNAFRLLPVTVPPVCEQRKIAGVLGLVQRAIEQQERLLTLTAELKRALLRQLFTRGLRGEPLKETEVGPVPGSWSVDPLGDYLTEAQYGVSVRGTEAGRYAVLRMTNQQEGRISGRNLQYVDLSPAQFARFRVERRDILFNRTNSLDLVGRTAIFDLVGDFVFASYLIRLRTDPNRLRPLFLNQYFNWEAVQRRLKSIATRAVSQSNISATRLRTFAIPVPRPDEQDEMVTILDCLDRKNRASSRKRCKTGRLVPNTATSIDDSADSGARPRPAGTKSRTRFMRKDWQPAAQGRRHMKKKNIGSTFDSWLREEDMYEEVSAAAIKRVIARQVENAMQERGLSKAEMARRMHTSRAALNRLLDPENDAVTLTTLQKAAAVVGRELRLELV